MKTSNHKHDSNVSKFLFYFDAVVELIEQVEQEVKEHGAHPDLNWLMLKMVLETLMILMIPTMTLTRR